MCKHCGCALELSSTHDLVTTRTLKRKGCPQTLTFRILKDVRSFCVGKQKSLPSCSNYVFSFVLLFKGALSFAPFSSVTHLCLPKIWSLSVCSFPDSTIEFRFRIVWSLAIE
ncbi:hypothetical protein CDAR_570791 [Caerostris darwini]|uniref:Uncharacterized protein n=1 Tax=Caerostris darwini TaxID=1538125 RepID=A0AAV4QD49_9ARAC|nr:hypothetical protein CDAR_570791 [Caerostris darwini]